MNIDLLSAIVGGLIAGIGAIGQAVVLYWLENKRELRQRLQEWEAAAYEWETSTQTRSFRRAILNGSDLRGVKLTFGLDSNKRMDLSFASFKKADLSSSSLIRADMRYTCLQGCTLVGTDFTNALLVSADFRGAKVDHAIFTPANLYQADLRNTDITHEQLESAETYAEALLPKHLLA